MNGFVSATHTHTLLKQTEQDRCGGGPIWEEKQSVIPQEKLLVSRPYLLFCFCVCFSSSDRQHKLHFTAH